MDDLVIDLLEMGFPEELIELAISKTMSKNILVLMDWMLAYEEGFDAPMTGGTTPVTSALKRPVPAPTEAWAASETAGTFGFAGTSAGPSVFPGTSAGPSGFAGTNAGQSRFAGASGIARKIGIPSLDDDSEIDTEESAKEPKYEITVTHFVRCDVCKDDFETMDEAEFHSDLSG